MPGGRPSSYRKKYCKVVIDLMAEGYSKEACAGHIGVAKSTIYEWEKHHQEFSDALKLGVTKSVLFWEGMGIHGTAGKLPGFNANSWFRNMQNRHGWSDKREVDNTSSDNSMTPKIVQRTVVKTSKSGG